MTKRCILRGVMALVAGLMIGACGDDPIEPSNGNGGSNEPSQKGLSLDYSFVKNYD